MEVVEVKNGYGGAGGGGTTVCVTGASGFIGSWLVMRLLQRGYYVRATVRDPDNTDKVKHLLDLPNATTHLSLWKADLDEDGSFDDAIQGCDGVFHVATPMNFVFVKDPENEYIKPTVDGVLNVMRSCCKAKTVKRIIYTSTMGTIEYQQKPPSQYDESIWTDVDFCRARKMFAWAIQKQHLVMERIHRLRQRATDTASQVESLQTELGRAKASFDRASTENNRLLGQLSEAEKKRDELQAELNALKESREKDCEEANNAGFKEAEDNYKKQVFATQDIYFKAGWKEACSKLGQGPETDVFAATPKAFLPVYLVPYANDVFTALQAEAEEELARETAVDTGEGSSPEQNVQNEPGDQERAPPVNIEDDYDNLSPLA